MKPIKSLKRNFPAVSGCFTPEQNAIYRLIFTCIHRKESLQESIFCDLLEMFTSVKANNMNNKILSSLQSLVWISNVSLGKKWAGLVLASSHPPAAQLCVWKDASPMPVCVVSATLLPSLAWARWDFFFSQEVSPEVMRSDCHVMRSDFLAGQGCIFKGFFQTSWAAGKSNFWV